MTDERYVPPREERPRPAWLDATLPFATGLVLVAAWQAAAVGWKIPQWLLPAPSVIAVTAADWARELVLHSGVTLYETLVGFVLAVAVAVPIAVVVVAIPILQTTVWPVLLALQSVPKVALAPLILLWVGIGELPKILVVFLVCFFPIVVGAATGLRAVPGPLLDLVESMMPTRTQVFVKVRFPVAMPHLFVGFKVAITFAVIGAVIAEFVGSERGLGYLILTSSAQSQTPLAFAAIILLTALSIVLYYLVELVERLVVPWSLPERRE